MLKHNDFSFAFKLSDIVFVMLISVKMPINLSVGVTEVCSNDPGHMTRI